MREFYASRNLVKRNFRHLTISTFVLLYKSMVRSHLDYCSSVWAVRNNWNRKQKFSFLVKIFKIFVTLLIYYYDVGLEVFGFAHSCRLCYVMLRYGHRSLWLAPITSAMLCYAMLC